MLLKVKIQGEWLQENIWNV